MIFQYIYFLSFLSYTHTYASAHVNLLCESYEYERFFTLSHRCRRVALYLDYSRILAKVVTPIIEFLLKIYYD